MRHPPRPGARAYISRRTLLLSFAAAVSPVGEALTQPAGLSATEYELKAIFLFRFSQFVEWPAESFASPEAPFVIGVLGEDPFGVNLDNAVRDELVANRPVVVQRYGRIDELDTCHILFIGGSATKNLPAIVSQLRGRSILTVGDTEDFARGGGMIRLLTVQNKIRLRVNLEAARAARLSISSKLLRSAEIVGAS